VSDQQSTDPPAETPQGDDGSLQELALSEARYRALVEGSSDFIYVLDTEGHFSFANAEVGHLLGYSLYEIIGRHYSEFLVSEDAERVGHAFHERRTGERVTRRVEVRLLSRGGLPATWRWPFDISPSPLTGFTEAAPMVLLAT